MSEDCHDSNNAPVTVGHFKSAPAVSVVRYADGTEAVATPLQVIVIRDAEHLREVLGLYTEGTQPETNSWRAEAFKPLAEKSAKCKS